jgi:putative transposase
MNRRLHAWAFALVQTRIQQKAKDAGIPVRYVNAAYTSQTCHACNRLGKRRTQAAFVCPYDDCHVSVFQADIGAAATIADRADPWGESLPWKSAGDDSPRDGSTSGSTTRRTQERAANGVATRTSARSGGDDNAKTSTHACGAAGSTQMTLCEDGPETDQETVSKLQSNSER